MGCSHCFTFSSLRLGFLNFFSASPPLFFYLLLFCRVSLLTNSHIFPFRLLAASSMARSKITPNPPPSPRNPPANTHRATPSSSRDPPRDPNVPSSQVVRPAPSRPNQAQPNPPHTSAAVRPLPNYKQLYPWASATLLGETSSINTNVDVLRLRKVIPFTFLSAKRTTTRCPFVLALAGNPFVLTTREATANPSVLSMPPCSKTSSFAFPSLASRGSF